MKKILNLLLAGVFFLSLCPTMVFATVYLGTGDNVDSGGHLDWDYDTQYYSQAKWGMNLWNNYKSGVIREDSVFVIQDLFITDVNLASAGYYGHRDKANARIYFNIPSMKKLTPDEQKSVAAHEFGHALGLGHNTNNINAIMTDAHYFPTVLHRDDKQSYDAASALY